MKKLLLLLMAFAMFGVAKAQFNVNPDNPGFEIWNSNGTPYQWTVLGSNGIGKFQKITFKLNNTSGGQDSFRVLPHHGDYFAGVFVTQSGPTALYQAKQWPTPDSVHYFNASVAFFPQLSGEATVLQAVMYNHHTPVDTSDHKKRDTVATSVILLNNGFVGPWTRVSAPFKFRTPGVSSADSIGILVLSSISNGTNYGVGTALLVDDLEFSDSNVNFIDTTNVIRITKTGLAQENHSNVNANVYAFPNPFTTSVNLYYTLPTSTEVNLSVYDMEGRRISTLVNGQQPAGTNSAVFDGTGLNEGVYMYRLQTNGQVQTGKLILSK